MWGDNTNGLSSTGLLRPTDSSSAIRRNYNYYYYYKIRDSSTAEKESIANFTKIQCHSYGFVLIFNITLLKTSVYERKLKRVPLTMQLKDDFKLSCWLLELYGAS